HVRRDARRRPLHVRLGTAAPQRRRRRERQPARDVAVEWIVRRRLIGHDIGNLATPYQLGEHLGAIAHEPDRERPALSLGLLAPAQGLVKGGGGPIEVAGLEATLHARGVDFDGEADALVHRGRERLGPPMPPSPPVSTSRPASEPAKWRRATAPNV